MSTVGPDDPLRRVVKAVARAGFMAHVRLRRWRQRRQQQERWILGGDCRRCAACCEQPSLQVDVVTWYFHRTFRAAFLWWQRTVNRFELVAVERPRTFVFRCLHFDPSTRRCDSYDSRPGICRDYPRNLLEQPWPEFLEGCGYRPVSKSGQQLLVKLNATPLTDEQRAKLKEQLRLE